MVRKVVELALLLAIVWLAFKLIVGPMLVVGAIVLSLLSVAVAGVVVIGLMALLGWGVYAVALGPLLRRTLR